MQYHARIIARNEEGVLERVLRVLRHRGYSTESLKAVCDLNHNQVHIAIDGATDRSLPHLARNIEKLQEVIQVTVSEREGEKPAKAASRLVSGARFLRQQSLRGLSTHASREDFCSWLEAHDLACTELQFEEAYNAFRRLCELKNEWSEHELLAIVRDIVHTAGLMSVKLANMSYLGV